MAGGLEQAGPGASAGSRVKNRFGILGRLWFQVLAPP
jgi:hypothetical protein